MIIKTFRKKGTGFYGQDIESWTDNWNEVTGGLYESIKGTENDHLSQFFKKYFPRPPKVILEGGCGIGKYIVTYRNLGYNMIGVDFSGDTINRIKKEFGADFPVHEADITALPFDDGYFDCYFSGGVIEHFEEGPDKPLREARRVIKQGGIFLVTIPYVNFLRRVYFSCFPVNEKSGFLQKKVQRCQRESGDAKNYNFCEYRFDINSIRLYFRENGFAIEGAFPTNFLWGEAGYLLRKFIIQPSKTKINKHSPDYGDKINILKDAKHNFSFVRKLTYNFIITENKDNIFSRLPITLLNYLSGHLLFFVARAV